MDQTTFDQVVKKQMMRCEAVLQRKAKHYAVTGEDRLVQFKKMAILENQTVYDSLGGVMAKHVTKLYDMLTMPEEFKMKDFDETITDLMNYLILLKALIVENSDE